MNPAHIDARVVMSSQMLASSKSTWVQVWAGLESAPDQFEYARRRRGGGDGRRSAMNPAHMNVRVVVPSQMCFGIVVLNEIHVGAGLGRVWNPPPINSNTRDDAVVGRAIGLP